MRGSRSVTLYALPSPQARRICERTHNRLLLSARLTYFVSLTVQISHLGTVTPSSTTGPKIANPTCWRRGGPGIFAVGDVRSGSTKRVASAVGEGSMAVTYVHQVLASTL